MEVQAAAVVQVEQVETLGPQEMLVPLVQEILGLQETPAAQEIQELQAEQEVAAVEYRVTLQGLPLAPLVLLGLVRMIVVATLVLVAQAAQHQQQEPQETQD